MALRLATAICLIDDEYEVIVENFVQPLIFPDFLFMKTIQ